MKIIIFLEIFISLILCAEENPFGLENNFQRIDKEQQILLDEVQNVTAPQQSKNDIVQIDISPYGEMSPTINFKQVKKVEHLSKFHDKKKIIPVKNNTKIVSEKKLIKEKEEAIRIKKEVEKKIAKQKAVKKRALEAAKNATVKKEAEKRAKEKKARIMRYKAKAKKLAAKKRNKKALKKVSRKEKRYKRVVKKSQPKMREKKELKSAADIEYEKAIKEVE